jgi:hypothetical protein
VKSPSEKLAALILERLIREKLLTRSEAKKVLSKLAEGKLRAEDWRAAIEISLPKQFNS